MTRYCNIIQHITIYYNPLHYITTDYNTLQHITILHIAGHADHLGSAASPAEYHPEGDQTLAGCSKARGQNGP